MPNPDAPKIEPWINKLKEIVVTSRKNDILVGHSIGCQTIIRFLEGLSNGQKVDKVIMVAPWLTLNNLESDESWKIADPWLKTPIDFSKVKTKANSFTAIFSDNDPWVPLDNQDDFKERLNSEIVIEHNKGHFSGDDEITQLPIVLKVLLRTSK